MSWLSFRGRIGRQTFWLAYMLPLILIGAAVGGVAGWAAAMHTGPKGVPPALPTQAIQLVNLALLWPSLAGTVKRLHDRGYSGWWVLFIWLMGVVPWILLLLFLAGVLAFGPIAAMGQGIVLLALLAALFGIVTGFWMFIELGFLRGTPGPNRFGPDPLGPAYPPGYGMPPGYGPQQGYYGSSPPPQQGGWGSPPPPPWGGQGR